MQFTYLNTVFEVGRNAKHNWELLEESNEHDIWVHLHDIPSCYVIIQKPNTVNEHCITKSHIEYACKLCIQNSRNKIPKNVKGVFLSYVECKYVKKGKSYGQAIMTKPPNKKYMKLANI